MKRQRLPHPDRTSDRSSANAGLNKEFVRRVHRSRHARHVERLLDEASREVRRRCAEIEREVNEHLRLEALTLLAKLPNFATMRRLPSGDDAYRAIRAVADRYGFPMAAITGLSMHPGVVQARAEAIKAVCDACPKLSDRVIGMLFSGMSALRVREIRKRGAA